MLFKPTYQVTPKGLSRAQDKRGSATDPGCHARWSALRSSDQEDLMESNVSVAVRNNIWGLWQVPIGE